MITEETIKHRELVSDVLAELDSFLGEKSSEYSTKLNAPYNSDEATEEESRIRIWEGQLAVAYTKLNSFVRAEETKYLMETNRMMIRYVHELETMLSKEEGKL